MKNLFKYIGIGLFASQLLNAQVGINTENPQIDLAIEESQTGLDFNGGILYIKNQNANGIAIDGNGNIGIGMEPVSTAKLTINAVNDIFTAKPSEYTSGSTNFLVQDPATGEIGTRAVPNSAGQMIRVGVNGRASELIANSQFTYDPNTETTLQIEGYNNASEMGTAPNGSDNFINTIQGATLSNDGSHSITLPAGTYKITIRLTGTFVQDANSGSATNEYRNKVALAIEVDGNLYTFADGVINGDGTQEKSGKLEEILELTSPSTIKFRIKTNDSNGVSNDFNPVAYYTAPDPSNSIPESERRVFRSLITIMSLK